MIRMKKSAKLWLRVLALALAMLLLGSSTVFAADMDDVPYYSYCYWEGPSRTVAVPMRTMYEATQQITSESLGLLDLYNAAVENDGVDPTYGVITNDPSKIEAVWSHIMMSPDMSELYALDGKESEKSLSRSGRHHHDAAPFFRQPLLHGVLLVLQGLVGGVECQWQIRIIPGIVRDRYACAVKGAHNCFITVCRSAPGTDPIIISEFIPEQSQRIRIAGQDQGTFVECEGTAGSHLNAPAAPATRGRFLLFRDKRFLPSWG